MSKYIIQNASLRKKQKLTQHSKNFWSFKINDKSLTKALKARSQKLWMVLFKFVNIKLVLFHAWKLFCCMLGFDAFLNLLPVKIMELKTNLQLSWVISIQKLWIWSAKNINTKLRIDDDIYHFIGILMYIARTTGFSLRGRAFECTSSLDQQAVSKLEIIF